jgi:phenylalanyl-tRNA synthetase beta chain
MSAWGTQAAGFFDLKGDVENLLHLLDHKTLYFDAHTAEHYRPGRSARAVMDGATVAEFGQIAPDIAAVRKLRQDVFVAEIYLDRLYQHELRQARYQPLPRYPAVQRDFSFVFDDAVAFEKIEKAVAGLRLPELRAFVPVEIFRGGSISPGRYSLLLRATLQSGERTLREDEVAQWSGEMVKVLEGLGGKLRG